MNRKAVYLSLTLILIVVPILLWFLTRDASPPRYTIQDLGMVPGYWAHDIMDMNNRGEVIGSLGGAQGFSPFLWSPREGMKSISTPDGPFTWVASINDRGDIAGGYHPKGFPQDRSATRESVVWISAKEVIRLGAIGGRDSNCAIINNRQEVVGGYRDPDNGASSYIWSATGGVRTLERAGPGIRGPHIFSINDTGQMLASTSVGKGKTAACTLYLESASGKAVIYGPTGTTKAPYTQSLNNGGEVVYCFNYRPKEFYRWSEAKGLKTIMAPLGLRALPMDLNDPGSVVGCLVYPRSRVRAWFKRHGQGRLADFLRLPDRREYFEATLWDNDKVIHLIDRIPRDSGWQTLETANVINNRGQIAGIGNKGGERSAFLLTPIEPNSLPDRAD